MLASNTGFVLSDFLYNSFPPFVHFSHMLRLLASRSIQCNNWIFTFGWTVPLHSQGTKVGKKVLWYCAPSFQTMALFPSIPPAWTSFVKTAECPKWPPLVSSPAGSARRPDEDPSSSFRWSRWSGKAGSRPCLMHAAGSASLRGPWRSSPYLVHLRCTYTWNEKQRGRRLNR